LFTGSAELSGCTPYKYGLETEQDEHYGQTKNSNNTLQLASLLLGIPLSPVTSVRLEFGVLQAFPWVADRLRSSSERRFTLLMERQIIDVLTECATVTATRCILRIIWDEAWGVMERAVRRGRERM